MRWLLLGYGDLSEKRVAAALQQARDSELRAVWGRNEQKCRDFSERHGITNCFFGIDGLNDAINEDIDAVYVCTPVDTHLEYTRQALEAGKHVICEKPMALNVDQCRKMVAIAEKSNLKLGIAYYRRLFANLLRVKEIIDTGQLGKIVYVNMMHQECYHPDRDDPQYWRLQPERSGGGVSYDIGSHRLDLLSYWFKNIKSIKTQAANLVHDYPAEDTATFFMELTDYQNTPAVLHVSWGCHCSVDSLTISGSDATLIVENLSGTEIILIHPNDSKTETFPVSSNIHLPLVEDFVRAVANDQEPVCNGREGMKTNILLESIKDMV